ncbi:MAG: aminotransferase class V-fold PLP-dependent enzyme [Candidatus Promineifilaceae bacterium]|nr:aminotransferase class V-fold PLP-dependent enzyme [Candidatus Promineifilaceae bacterium]
MMKELFMLDPDVVFLNHGSFGATPRPVFAEYQRWQANLECQPVQFLANELAGHLQKARASLGEFLNADKDDLVYIPNATFGVNVVSRSLKLGEGDEVLTTNHEYGACNNVWQFLSRKIGFTYKQAEISLPISSDEALVEEVWQGVTPATRVIFISHISSPTACEFPVKAVCSRARESGILTVIDGAHAPGQISLDMQAIGADFYCGNAHKWLCAPKGSGFLYTRREQQSLIEPLVVGWGWGEGRTFSFGSDYLDYLQWLGTNDLSAYLAVPAAIRFQEEHDWPSVRRKCHELLLEALERIGALTGLDSLYLGDEFHQMATAPLPKIRDLLELKAQLYDAYRIEVPLIEWEDQHFIRISVQAYNTEADIHTLLAALRQLLPIYRA